jgi:eukaryotic-like serine/threonine-protein kinase
MQDDDLLRTASPNRHPDGERIAGYRLLRVLGEGGMGVVYLAEQTDPVRREVALKVLKAGMDTRQVVARFEAERQSLAVMEHPGIARVFDGGSTEAGLPYFVMERVDGVPITDYCDAERLDIRARVRLFAQVCRAVQHAHQKGVIHRDLKPSNVLVTVPDHEPVCKVIDFGIARAVEQPADEAARLTQLDQLSPGTPAYMSPEQVEAGGRDIDTRSDIYSLGVLLYELLAGVLPFNASAYRGWALYAHHQVREPPVPSARVADLPAEEQARLAAARRTDGSGLRRQIRGDLDWVVMRALEKDRDRRYETANGLAMDLERYLASEPVSAGPPGRAYRAGKFVRRHRAAVAFAAVLAVLLIGFAGAMAVQADRVARARDLAVVRQGQAEGLIDFMLTDLRAKLEPVGRLDLLGDVGHQALAYFAALPGDQFSDGELLSRSQALGQIGQVRLHAGEAAEATGPLRESLRLATELSSRAPDDTRRLFQLAQSHFWVGFAAWRTRELDDAEAAFLSYLDVARRLVELEPDDPDFRLEVGYAHSNLGSVREARGDFPGAIEAYTATLAVKEELVRREPDRIGWVGELAETHNTLAVAHRKSGSYGLAMEAHLRELELKRAALEIDPTHAYWRARLSWAHLFVGDLQLMIGRPAAALDHYRLAAATADSLVRHDPANVDWRRGGVVALRGVAMALAALGQGSQALPMLQSADGRFQELAGIDPAAFDWSMERGRTRIALARALLDLGRPADALAEADHASDHLAAARPAARNTRIARAEAEVVRGRSLAALGRPADAAAAYEQGLEHLQPLAAGVDAAEVEPLLAEAYLGLGRLEDADRILRDLDQRGYRGHHLASQLRARGRAGPD